MKTIHKFRLETGKDITTLTLREGYQIVRCEYVLSAKAVYLWVEQPLSVSTPSTEQRFRVVHSGEPVPNEFNYVGTALDPFGPEAYHLFQLPTAAKHRVTPIRPTMTSAQASNSDSLHRASA